MPKAAEAAFSILPKAAEAAFSILPPAKLARSAPNGLNTAIYSKNGGFSKKGQQALRVYKSQTSKELRPI